MKSFYSYAESSISECHYSECLYTNSRGAIDQAETISGAPL
jgi:hypothetical protein